jgi:hypothetical protein
MGVAEVVAVLRANTSQFTAKLGETRARAEMNKLGKSGASNFEKMSDVGKAGLLGIDAAAVGNARVANPMTELAPDRTF